MQYHTRTFCLTTITLAGCGLFTPIDPCADGSPLQQDPSVAQDCQTCNQSPCPDDEGETEEDLADEIWCTNPHENGITTCADLPGGVLAMLGDWVSRSLDSCGELSQEYECTLLGQSFDCHQCEVLVWGGWAPQGQSVSNDGWHLCWHDDMQRYVPAFVLDVDEPAPDWVGSLGCGAAVDAGTCPLGFVEHIGDTATCRCVSDADCQPGTVCEGNYSLVNGQIRPTECTWDGAPDIVGPEVYGLAKWEDGISISGDRVTVSAGMLLALTPRDGQGVALLNDDQSVDALGTISHCGRGSLCEYLGLRVGETPLVYQETLDKIAVGKPAAIEVVGVTGRSRWLTVSVKLP
jgi:hypothetical protein